MSCLDSQNECEFENNEDRCRGGTTFAIITRRSSDMWHSRKLCAEPAADRCVAQSVAEDGCHRRGCERRRERRGGGGDGGVGATSVQAQPKINKTIGDRDRLIRHFQDMASTVTLTLVFQSLGHCGHTTTCMVPACNATRGSNCLRAPQGRGLPPYPRRPTRRGTATPCCSTRWSS